MGAQEAQTMYNCTAAAPAIVASPRDEVGSAVLLNVLVTLVAMLLAAVLLGVVWLRSWLRSIAAQPATPPAPLPATPLPAAQPCPLPESSSSGCPFGYGDAPAATPGKQRLSTREKQAARMGRVTSLYEDYIHLHDLRAVWATPVTDKPAMEPNFAAAMHGIEIAFILMAEFIKDTRQYVVKRPRVELVAADVIEQCGILAEIVDGELEDEACVGAEQVRKSLIREFPFEGAPPTLTQEDVGFGRQSLGLDMLIDAVSHSFPVMSVPERHSMIKVVRTVTCKIDSSFCTWSVGIGWEDQLRQLRQVRPDKHFPLPQSFHHTKLISRRGAVRWPAAARKRTEARVSELFGARPTCRLCKHSAARDLQARGGLLLSQRPPRD